jgi:hypothetical protein
MSMQDEHAAWTCSMDMQHRYTARKAAWACNMHNWTCSMVKQHGLAIWKIGDVASTSSMDMQHGYAGWRQEPAAWT